MKQRVTLIFMILVSFVLSCGDKTPDGDVGLRTSEEEEYESFSGTDSDVPTDLGCGFTIQEIYDPINDVMYETFLAIPCNELSSPLTELDDVQEESDNDDYLGGFYNTIDELCEVVQ